MLEFILGGAGCGKSTLLIDKIEKLSESDKKIIFIVPEQFSFETDKKIYKRIGPDKFNKILSLSFTSLAKEIFESFGGKSGEYADDIQKFIIMNKAIGELVDTKAFEYYNKHAAKPEFTNEALDIINEFRQCGISSEELLNICTKTNDESGKLRDLSMIYTVYDRMLSEANLKDSLTDISEAAAIASMNDYFKDCIIVFDEFESFTGDQYEMIDAMFSQSDSIYIALRLEDPENNQYGIFESVEKTWKKFYQLAKKYNIEINQNKLKKPLKYKSNELSFLNRNIMRNNGNIYGKSENISITQCRDLYEEADFAAAQIRELVSKNGYKYKDIAVVSRQLEEYIYILEPAFKKYDIPFFMSIKKNAYHTRIMQFIVNTVNIMCEKNPSIESVLTYIKTSLANVSIKTISELENYSYEWDLKGEDFFKEFEYGIENNRHLEEYRQELINPVLKLREQCKNADCKTICKNLYDFLFQLKIPLRLSELNDSFIKQGLINEAKEQKRIWDMLMRMLDTLSEIGGKVSPEEFNSLFNSAAESIAFSVPPQTLDSVHIAKSHTARLANPKVVFILGVNDGFFPMAVKKKGLLSDKDRTIFEAAGINLSRGNDELAADEKLAVYKALTNPSEKLYITFPNSSNSGEERYPSLIVNQIDKMFGGNNIKSASDKGLLFYCSTEKAAYNIFVRNFGNHSAEIKAIEKVLRENEVYNAKIDYLYKAAKQKDFAIEDKNLIKRLYTDKLTISPTAFEDFNMCHFRFFCKTALNLKTLRKREIQNLETGNIVHSCLEKIISSCNTKEEFDNLDEKSIVSMINQCVEQYMQENMGGNSRKTIRINSLVENIKKDILNLVLQLQEELKQSLFRPVEFEFSVNNKIPVIKTDTGIEVYLNGIVDRIDMYEEENKKYIRVIDYKTGSRTFSVDSLYYGINMQMILYMFSVTGEGGKYNNCTPAGVLYMPSKEIKCDRNRDDDKSIEKHLNEHYKMNGVVLKERHVLSAMEKDIAGVYIPAKLKNDDTGDGELSLNKTVSKWCFDSSEFQNLKKHTEKLLKQLADELYMGKIEANPLIKGNLVPCEICDYWSVCGNYPYTKSHTADENAEEIMLDIISGETNN